MKRSRELRRQLLRQKNLENRKKAIKKARSTSWMIGDGKTLIDVGMNEPLETVLDVVNPSMFVRTNEQSINISAIGYLAAGVGVVVLWFMLIQNTIDKSTARRIESATRMASYGQNQNLEVNFPIPTSTPVVVDLVVNTIIITPTAEPVPTEQVPEYQIEHVAYSYYDPDLGGVNCHVDNWNGYTCEDTTASGISWRDYIDQGVAIPPSWYAGGMGYGSIIRVTEPEVMRGDYTVIDLCSACEKEFWNDGQYRFDFLSQQQKLPWAYMVEIQLISLVPTR